MQAEIRCTTPGQLPCSFFQCLDIGQKTKEKAVRESLSDKYDLKTRRRRRNSIESCPSLTAAAELEEVLLEAGVECEGERLAVDDDRDGVVLANQALPLEVDQLLSDLVPSRDYLG